VHICIPAGLPSSTGEDVWEAQLWDSSFLQVLVTLSKRRVDWSDAHWNNISCIGNMEQRRLVEISSQQSDVRTFIISSKFPFFIRHFRCHFYQLLNQILDAFTTDSKRLHHLRTTWLEDLDLARNHFSQNTTAKETSLSVEKRLFFPAYCSLVHNWHLCGLTTHYASAIVNGTGLQTREHISLQRKTYISHSKPFCAYYRDLCSQSLWRPSNGDVTVNILIHQMTTCIIWITRTGRRLYFSKASTQLWNQDSLLINGCRWL